MMIQHKAELDLIVERVLKQATEQGKLSGFCIGNTRKVNESGLYFSPLRVTARMVAGSVIVYDIDQAQWIAEQVDGRVDYIFVDTEKKVALHNFDNEKTSVGNVEREVRETVKTSKVLTYKGNDLTVDSIENFIVQLVSAHPRGLGGKKGVIIGAGNIGSKLALKLVERGMDITITRRDPAKLEAIVNALNVIKPPATLATVRGTVDNLEAAQGADLLIGLTEGISAITAQMVDAVNVGAFLLDGGKGCFSTDAIERARLRALPIYRADVRPGFEGHSAMALATEEMCAKGVGRIEIEGVSMISGGLLGSLNEVVVDSIHHPKRVFGVANGLGDFVRTLDADQLDAVKTIQTHIEKRNVS